MCKLCLLVVLLPLALCGDVISLTKNSKAELSKHPLALVKYYAPWCGHCKALAPHYEEAATVLKNSVPPVTLFEVNCDEEKEMCDDAGVGGFPTLKAYAHGDHIEDFDGQRTKEGIVEFMIQLSAPPASEIVDEKHLSLILESDDYAIILQSADSMEIKKFEAVAKKLRKFVKFYYTKNNLLDSVDLLLQLNRPKILETKLEDRTLVYDGAMLETDIERWIRKKLVGLAGIRQQKMEEFFHKPLLVVYTKVSLERNPADIRYYRNRLIQVANETKTDLQFALADAFQYATELYEIGITQDEKTTTVAIHAKDGQNYIMQDKFGVAELKNFVLDFARGSLEPFVKSEPIPEKQENAVVKVVGKTFKEIVYDTSKDVLIEFFAPWCGHCKALKPKYEELALKLSKEKDLVIAAIDATANSYPPEFAIRGYPSIFWVPKGSKNKPQSYDGPREVQDMLEFVSKSATEELTHFNRHGVAKQGEL